MGLSASVGDPVPFGCLRSCAHAASNDFRMAGVFPAPSGQTGSHRLFSLPGRWLYLRRNRNDQQIHPLLGKCHGIGGHTGDRNAPLFRSGQLSLRPVCAGCAADDYCCLFIHHSASVVLCLLSGSHFGHGRVVALWGQDCLLPAPACCFLWHS